MFATTVKAYVLKDYRWPSATTTFNVDIPEADGLWNTAFEAAMARWNDATIFDFRIRRDTYEDPCDTGDSENGVGFADDVCGEAFGEMALAVEQSWFRGTETTESNIHFNTAYSWNVYDGPYQTGGWDGIEDFRRVAVHELGHALGLLHEESTRSIMAAEQRWGSTIVAPQADDIAGVAALFEETMASAQHKYIFPQFAFGGGWESTLMVQARDVPTVCTFSAQDRFLTMRGLLGNNISGTSIGLTLGMNGWTILKTETPQGMAASSGMAVLDCDEEVTANTLFSLEVGGSLVAEAVVESAEEIVPGGPVAQFLADHRDGARFAMAVANPSEQPLEVLVGVGDLDGQIIGEDMVNVPANAAQAFFVDELVTIPTGHTGQVFIWPSNNPGPSVYVVGLRVTGLVITTIPATVLRPEPPAAGLNTRLTDPNGQWTASAKAKIIEKNDTYWEFSYFVDMTNRTNEEQEYTVKIHFVDADGFSIEYSYAGDLFNKIPAGSTKRLLDQELIDTENAPTVVGILLEVNVR